MSYITLRLFVKEKILTFVDQLMVDFRMHDAPYRCLVFVERRKGKEKLASKENFAVFAEKELARSLSFAGLNQRGKAKQSRHSELNITNAMLWGGGRGFDILPHFTSLPRFILSLSIR